ncbi:hypothetical protein Har1130_09810 [Haloarcula sp. CBA1130]|uniref:hypothetical protein n=1 Tax=unclassified Haloarcula TaxID=2624677 RepID=UPI001247533F|nr:MULTISPECIES: hypothetical protein [unclassified Haloarcula]KAA9396939.1 hypothetical protein Har1129_01260 [Haloarcula sp. CBA1129]KAA9403023.1 hypothetical protein Har1130_09810 [Haloarcula sp. CBA1130]
MASVDDHRRRKTDLPAAATDYFASELDTIDSYLETLPATIDAAAGDAAVGPIHALPWFYVADLTGWRGSTLARLLAAERDAACYELSAGAADALPALWSLIDESDRGPVVLHLELQGESGRIPRTLREALRRGYAHTPDGWDEPVRGEPANLHVVFTDTNPSKRLEVPLPAATTPTTGAVLSYAPRRSMLPERPDGTTMLADPPALHDREDELEGFLLTALADSGDDDARERYVGHAVEVLSITHSLIGKRDLLFDVSPRLALKYGNLLDSLSVSAATERLGRDVLGQVPQSPGSEDIRATLRDLLPE